MLRIIATHKLHHLFGNYGSNTVLARDGRDRNIVAVLRSRIYCCEPIYYIAINRKTFSSTQPMVSRPEQGFVAVVLALVDRLESVCPANKRIYIGAM